jgi:hypothetical protein
LNHKLYVWRANTDRWSMYSKCTGRRLFQQVAVRSRERKPAEHAALLSVFIYYLHPGPLLSLPLGNCDLQLAIILHWIRFQPTKGTCLKIHLQSFGSNKLGTSEISSRDLNNTRMGIGKTLFTPGRGISAFSTAPASPSCTAVRACFEGMVRISCSSTQRRVIPWVSGRERRSLVILRLECKSFSA